MFEEGGITSIVEPDEIKEQVSDNEVGRQLKGRGGARRPVKCNGFDVGRGGGVAK